jgi:hypothetical protein
VLTIEGPTGPRISSLPPLHPFHPSQMFFKKHLNDEGALPVYLALLASPVPQIREQGAPYFSSPRSRRL